MQPLTSTASHQDRVAIHLPVKDAGDGSRGEVKRTSKALTLIKDRHNWKRVDQILKTFTILRRYLSAYPRSGYVSLRAGNIIACVSHLRELLKCLREILAPAICSASSSKSASSSTTPTKRKSVDLLSGKPSSMRPSSSSSGRYRSYDFLTADDVLAGSTAITTKGICLVHMPLSMLLSGSCDLGNCTCAKM